jgi:hypothetical protein
MGGATGLDADHAGRQQLEVVDDVAAFQLAACDHLSARVDGMDLEPGFREIKLLYLVMRRVEKNWKMAQREWTAAMTQFAILFGERWVVER